jgi:DNA mismatch repair protein MutL
MGKIIILDEYTSNKIAAGEVIERPASVVKELVENSIDAGAGSISIEIKNGGVSYIKVSDNGAGFDEDDVEIAFERHSTSKIKSPSDLDTISTFGFRDAYMTFFIHILQMFMSLI